MIDSRGYAYRSRRDGCRVVREYLGGGIVAVLDARRQERERERQEARRAAERRERAALDALDAPAAAFANLVRLVTHAALLEAGYRQHARGQWRKRRGHAPEA